MSRRGGKLVLGCCVAAVAGIAGAWASGVRINLTPSMPLGLWQVSGAADVRRGAAAVVCTPRGDATRVGRERGYIGPGACPNGTEPLLKVVAAVAGDTVAVTPDGLAVNGEALPGTGRRTHDTAGRELRAWPAGIYTVQPGTAWVVTPAPDSWDSRYWGPVQAGDVLGTARPMAVLP